MASNLANVYATLMRKYGDNLTIKYTTPPSYLLNIVGQRDGNADGKIVFVYVEDRNSGKCLNTVSPSKLNIKKSNSDLDLTGSPLKDDCIVDAIADLSLDIKMLDINPWRMEEESHKGISVDKARSIISNEDIQASGKDDAKGALWLLCNCTDYEKTLFLQYEFTQKTFSRGIVTFVGLVPTYAVNTQSLLKQHYQLIRSGSRLETYIENTYYIKTHIALRCSWSTFAAIPSLIDLSTCDVSLTQKFNFKDCGPLTQDFMNQLRILMYIREDILAYKESELSDVPKEPLYRCGSGTDMEELRESINKVMTEMSGFAEIDINAAAESDLEAVIQHAKLRRLTDLTDKLWDTLKVCSNYKDLKVAFNIVFQCAARCNIVNTPTNKNRLAEIITEVANRRLAIPCLSGSEPLELLLEIGLEKLYKDYEFILDGSQICCASVLKNIGTLTESKESDAGLPSVRKSLRNAVRQPDTPSTRKTLLHNNIKMPSKYESDDIMGFKNSNFNETETAKKLARLLQIHCALEHLLMIHINLNLSTAVYGDVCEQLLKKPARIVDNIDDSMVDEIEISLSAHDIRDHLEGKDPNCRRITMKSENKFREVKSTFYFTIDNVCPPSISEYFDADDKEVTKDSMYYGWLYRKIKTLK